MKPDGNTEITASILSDDPHERSKALKELYHSSFPKIEAFVVRNSGRVSDAKDVFQEGILILYENISSKTFEGRAKAETYLFSICKNLWLQELRKSKKHDDFLENMTHKRETEDIRSVNTSLLSDIFEQLKEDCQHILVAFYYQSKSIKELQAQFGMSSEQVVKNKKSRCLRYLMEIARARNLDKHSFFNE